MNTFGKKVLAGLVGASLGLALAGPANADMFAYSKTDLTNFRILGSDGDILDFADFATLSYTSSADMQGSLTGTAGFNFNVPNGANTDFPSSCLSTTGACPALAENAFPFLSGAQGTDYVAADQIETGAPISGLAGFTDPAHIGGIAVGSLSATAAEGTANVNNGLEASWTFALTQDTGITFEGDVDTYLEAFASAGELAPGKASAATTFEITITDLTTGQIVFVLAPDLLNETTSLNANGFPVDLTTCGGMSAVFGTCGVELGTSFSATTGILTGGTLYQLSARINNNIDIARVQPVPEPGVLALFGLGLLGVFVAAPRRRKLGLAA